MEVRGRPAALVASVGGTTSPVAVPPSHPTTVLGRTATAPAGSTAATVSSSLVQPAPNAPATRCRAATGSAPGTGSMSRGSSDTASPRVTILPSSATRTVSGVSAALASVEPVSRTTRAGATPPGATTTVAPSVSPALDSVMSSSVAWPAGPSAGATSAVVTRAPVSATASHDCSPSASMTSGCSLTTPRRASMAAAASRATSVISGATRPT